MNEEAADINQTQLEAISNIALERINPILAQAEQIHHSAGYVILVNLCADMLVASQDADLLLSEFVRAVQDIYGRKMANIMAEAKFSTKH